MPTRTARAKKAFCCQISPEYDFLRRAEKGRQSKAKIFGIFRLEEMDSTRTAPPTPKPQTHFSPSLPRLISPSTLSLLSGRDGSFLHFFHATTSRVEELEGNQAGLGQEMRLLSNSQTLVHQGEKELSFSFTSSCPSLSIFNLMERSACMSADSACLQCPVNRGVEEVRPCMKLPLNASIILGGG